jgi:hypothetical protein
MYPADRLFPFSTDPDFFTFDDLPDELEYNGSIWPKTIELFSGGGTSACWKLYQSPDDEEDMILWNVDENEYGTLGCADGDGPNYTRQQSLGIVCCLIDLDFQDQFADTYTISYGGIQFVGPATRQSLCFWQSDECQSPNRWAWEIQYGALLGLEEPYKWAVFLKEPGGGECIPAGFFIKNDPQNSPAGTYSDGTQTLTVS